MSTPFKPIQIPPGVVALPTKKMRSSNWSEVNFMRWREGQLMPMGGQVQFISEAPTGIVIAAAKASAIGATTITIVSNPGTIQPNMTVDDLTTGENDIGVVRSLSAITAGLAATATTPAGNFTINMVPNPGWVLPGMSVFDETTSANIGTVAAYGPQTTTRNLSESAIYSPGDTTFTMATPNNGNLINPGMSVFNISDNVSWGLVVSYVGNTLVTSRPATTTSNGGGLRFSSGGAHQLILAGVSLASVGAGDLLLFGATSEPGQCLVTLKAPLTVAVGSGDQIRFNGDSYVFASRCKRIHGWFDLNQVYHIAYLCEQHLYVDTAGILSEITPVDGMSPPEGLVGGYGDGIYPDPNNPPTPDDLYSTPRAVPGSVAITKIPDCYSIDNFGAILYAMTSADGRLLMWDPSVGGAAVVQPANANRGPVPNGRCFVITQERFLMILGSYNDGTTDGGSFRRFAWCDQENPGAWDYSNVVSQAGFLDVEPASPIVTADATRMGVLFWTGKKAYVSQFLGLPYIYDYVEIGDACTPWSPQSVVTTTAMTLWMAEQGMFAFDGTSVVPIPCKIRPWIDDNIDPVAVRELSFSAHLAEFNEWWWFYPTLNSPFNTRAAVYNYKEGWFTQCRLSRSAGITSSYTAYPIFADDFVAFQHEVFQSTSYANANMPVMLPFAESFDLNLNSGARLTTIKQLMPDVEAIDPPNPQAIAEAIQNLSYSVFYRRTRSIGDPELQAPGVFRPDGYIDFRVTGRDLRLRIDVGPVIRPFTLGQHLVDAVPRGDR
jgi:hypothetical protein